MRRIVTTDTDTDKDTPGCRQRDRERQTERQQTQQRAEWHTHTHTHTHTHRLRHIHSKEQTDKRQKTRQAADRQQTQQRADRQIDTADADIRHRHSRDRQQTDQAADREQTQQTADRQTQQIYKLHIDRQNRQRTQQPQTDSTTRWNKNTLQSNSLLACTAPFQTWDVEFVFHNPQSVSVGKRKEDKVHLTRLEQREPNHTCINERQTLEKKLTSSIAWKIMKYCRKRLENPISIVLPNSTWKCFPCYGNILEIKLLYCGRGPVFPVNTTNKYIEGDFSILVPGVISSRKNKRSKGFSFTGRWRHKRSKGRKRNKSPDQWDFDETKEEKTPEEIRLKEKN